MTKLANYCEDQWVVQEATVANCRKINQQLDPACCPFDCILQGMQARRIY